MSAVAVRRILWTCPYLPWPLTSGGRVRQFHLLSQMHRRGHAITLLVQSKTPVDDAARRALEPLVERLIVLPRRPLRSVRTLLAAATSRLPVLAAVNGYAPDLSATFDALLAQPWDVVQVEHSYSAQPFLDALAERGRPFVLTEHNVESSLGRATYGKWPGVMRPLASYDRWRARRWERRVLSSAERVIAVTDEDARALQAIARRPTDVVGNGVDIGAFAAVEPAVDSARVLFVGNFEYAPNVDAVEWTLAEVMPRVWLEQPDAHLVVCGFALPSRWRNEHVDPRVTWLGYVPRLQDVQRSSAAFIAPLRDGGGSKLKVLEAMAAGLPLVTTREGVSGLAVRPGHDALLPDDADGLASALVELLSHPTRARAIGEAGRRFVRAHHDWTAAADALEAVHDRVARPAVARRDAANDARATLRVGIDYRAVTAAPLSGIARQVRALESVLAARPGTQVRLFTAGPHDHPHRAIASCPPRSSPAHRLHHPLHRLRFERDHLPHAIDDEALDVYVATINMGLPIGRLRSATRLVLVLHDPFQITLRNRHASRLREWFYRCSDRWSIGHSVRVADAIWTPTTFVADALATLFPDARPRIRVLPNAVPLDLWTNPPPVRPRDLPPRFWLAVGTAEPRKNIPWFVRQWQAAGGAATLPPLVLVGRSADLPASLATLDGLHFVEGLSDAELADLYRRAERLWQPSYAEGFGLPVVEAAACGTPIASAYGSSLDEITPPGSPRFDPHDGPALQALMRALATAPRDALESADRLQAWATRFDLPSYASRVDRLVSELCA